MSIQRTVLLIADIGGYTRFMKQHSLALAHAQDAVAKLLEAVIDAAKPLKVRSWKATRPSCTHRRKRMPTSRRSPPS